jgi:hypothetical protein
MVGRYVYFAEKCRRSIPAESTSTVTPFRNRHGRVYRTTEELPHLAGERFYLLKRRVRPISGTVRDRVFAGSPGIFRG